MFRGEMDPGCCGREGDVVSEKGERERGIQGNAQERFPIVIGLANERG